MIDLNSPEFYAIAFVVAMALVALLMGRSEKNPPSTYIFQLVTEPDDNGDSDDTVCLEPIDGGKVRITRTGITLLPEETVNLVFTIRDDECLIVEKKGVRRRGKPGSPVAGEVTVKCFKPMKYRVRYESQLTSAWARFTLDAASSQPAKVTLKY